MFTSQRVCYCVSLPLHLLSVQGLYRRASLLSLQQPGQCWHLVGPQATCLRCSVSLVMCWSRLIPARKGQLPASHPRCVFCVTVLVSATVGVFTPQKWASAVYPDVSPGKLVVKHLPELYSTQMNTCHWNMSPLLREVVPI